MAQSVESSDELLSVDCNQTGRKKALIAGITGQDGRYLSELLLDRNYEVHGIIRRSSTMNKENVLRLYFADVVKERNRKEENSIQLHYGDLTDSTSLVKLIYEIRPNEVYNLSAQSDVKASFDMAEYTAEVDAVGTLRLLDAIRTCKLDKSVRFYQASSSEMFGKIAETPQTEKTPFYPRSPYGVAKLYAYWITVNYREAYDMFAVNGTLFNHESPRRGENFVTRKITRGVAKIHLGQQEFITLGNLDAKRDWGHAKDYVEAMWLMLQQQVPEDYIIATNTLHTVRQFVEAAFKETGKEIM